MQHREPVTVLIAPLDWGLGHATRCIPIIRELISQGARVIIGSQGPQKDLLKMEFPGLEILDLPGYAVRYRRGVFLKWGLVFRIPALLKQIKRENQWLADTKELYKLDAVISDTRWGLYHPDLHSVFLTHQLAVQSGLGSLFDRIVMRWQYRLIRKFSVCWVPDWPGHISLAGRLSHPVIPPPIPTEYIGPLSRLKPIQDKVEKNNLLIIISGPEPQRTDFEKCILPQLENLTMGCTLIRGLPGGETSDSISTNSVDIFNHLSTEDLNVLLNRSALTVTRSGYSSIMDLARLEKNAILIPTPGQTEQEYLGQHMQKMNWMLTVPQKNFNLKKAIIKFQAAKLSPPLIQQPELGKPIAELVNNCVEMKRSALSLKR